MVLAAGLALAVTPWVSREIGTTVYDTPGLLGAVAVQALAGAGLGVLALILMTAVTGLRPRCSICSAGSRSRRPTIRSTTPKPAIWGRVDDLLAVVLLFVNNGDLLLLKGFINIVPGRAAARPAPRTASHRPSSAT